MLEVTHKLYEVDTAKVSSTTSSIYLASVLCSIPSIFLLRRKGISFSIKLASFVMAVGFFLRSFINTWFEFVILGQILIGISIPTINNS